jgi:hypothetical protein
MQLTIPKEIYLPLDIATTGSSQACKSFNCKTCNLLNKDVFFYSTVFERKFYLLDAFNCHSCNIVYLITCLKCNIQYVGETGNALQSRMNGHRYCIKFNKDTPVGIHFNSPNHNLSHLTVMPIEKIKSNNMSERRAREFYWQLKLGTIFPRGLNNFPVKIRNRFKNLNINTFTDLELFWALINLDDSDDSN